MKGSCLTLELQPSGGCLFGITVSKSELLAFGQATVHDLVEFADELFAGEREPTKKSPARRGRGAITVSLGSRTQPVSLPARRPRTERRRSQTGTRLAAGKRSAASRPRTARAKRPAR